MSKGRRVGGSGWAGVYGSFVGLRKATSAAKPSVRLGKAKKKKPEPKKESEPIAIDLAALPDNEALKAAARRVLAVQSDISDTKKRLQTLESQLAVLIEKFRVAENLVMPALPSQLPAKARAKAPKR